jgi:hypothetical protein
MMAFGSKAVSMTPVRLAVELVLDLGLDLLDG